MQLIVKVGIILLDYLDIFVGALRRGCLVTGLKIFGSYFFSCNANKTWSSRASWFVSQNIKESLSNILLLLGRTLLLDVDSEQDVFLNVITPLPVLCKHFLMDWCGFGPVGI